jgi:hypothetical protein
MRDVNKHTKKVLMGYDLVILKTQPASQFGCLAGAKPPATRNLQRAPVAASHRPCSANMRNIWEATPLAEATISGQRVAGIDSIKLNKKNRRGHLNDRNNQSSGKKPKGYLAGYKTGSIPTRQGRYPAHS